MTKASLWPTYRSANVTAPVRVSTEVTGAVPAGPCCETVCQAEPSQTFSAPMVDSSCADDPHEHRRPRADSAGSGISGPARPRAPSRDPVVVGSGRGRQSTDRVDLADGLRRRGRLHEGELSDVGAGVP